MEFPRAIKRAVILGVVLSLSVILFNGKFSQTFNDASLDWDESKLTIEQRIDLLNRNANDPELSKYKSLDLFNRTCFDADIQYYDALVKTFRSFDGDPTFLPGIATLFLRREVAKLQAHPPSTFDFPWVETVASQTIPAPLQKAHLLAKSISAPYRNLPEAAVSISYHENGKQWSEPDHPVL